MATKTINIQDATLVVNGSPITDYAEGTELTVSWVNPKMNRSRGRNTIAFEKHSQHDEATITINLTRGSADDRYMHNLMMSGNTINGSLSETMLDDNGNTITDVYRFTSGNVGEIGDKTRETTSINVSSEYTIQAVVERKI